MNEIEKEGYYTRYGITSADTTGKYETSNPGDHYQKELNHLWSAYHNIKNHSYKFLYYDPKTDEDQKQFWKDVKSYKLGKTKV